jgi:hypothetical protein
MAQLESLNAMERQQDTNLWTSSAIYLAANGVLLLAVASLVGRFRHWELAVIGIGILGVLVVYVWMVTASRAHTYETLWIGRAKAVQDAMGVPAGFRVWDPSPPLGRRAGPANRRLRYTFMAVWWIVMILSAASALGYSF